MIIWHILNTYFYYRSVARNAASSSGAVNNSASARRSRSRNRAAAVAAAAIAATVQGRANPRQRRGRSAGAAKGKIIRNGKADKNAKVKATNGVKSGPQQQVRRGRSRSRKPTGKSETSGQETNRTGSGNRHLKLKIDIFLSLLSTYTLD